ncbi:DUF3885 domain-containing protein [Paenibacillus vietnamensis]|uniref:DUF3885 domain-containing protein n=1 Tax=Paenibacillus vietnamensis TaxID=2590547 RepID=UPI001CD12760|nr:DUF3885 domain-containing protein [Paenibacillus vietnamensis]
MIFERFMNEKFPYLVLKPPLFYNWDIGIRFELGDPRFYDLDTNHYMERVYFRAIELFKALHDNNDEIVIVTNGHFADKQRNQVKKLYLYKRYIKSKRLLRNLRLDVIPYVFADEDENPDELTKTYRYMITCKVYELDYRNLLKAICNQDVGIKPKTHHDVFFLNINNGTIYHVHDDRGCDIISHSNQAIKEIYLKYKDWILDYDRETIDKTFEE